MLGLSSDISGRVVREPGSPRILNPTFSVGDKVKISVTVERLREMQEGHGGSSKKLFIFHSNFIFLNILFRVPGWNPRMAEV